MKGLNSNTLDLLGKLYNFRSEDSIILKEMDKEKEEASKLKESTKKEKELLEKQIDELSKKEDILSKEGQNLIDSLSKINSNDFETVLKNLEIEFNPSDIKKKVEEKLPVTIKNVLKEKNTAKENLVNVEKEMNDAIARIEELGIRRDEAVSNQERLNHYFELALDSNINITRDELTSLLEKFSLSEDDQREAAKLLMFPEDGLFEYENSFLDKPVNTKSIKDVIQEAKKTEEIKVEEVLEPVKEEPIIIEEEPVIVEEKPIIEVKKVEDVTKEEVAKKITSLGFDSLDFTSADYANMIANYDEVLFENNTYMVENAGIMKDIFNDNVALFYDKELEDKVNTILGVGKTAQDIYLNPNILSKYNYKELQEAIKVLQDNGLNPKNVPLMAY